EANHDIFKSQDGVSLKQAWELYKQYCEESDVKRYPLYKFRSELENYFENVEDRALVDGERVRNWYSGYKDIMKTPEPREEPVEETGIKLHEFTGENVLNDILANQPAQYAKEIGSQVQPGKKWKDVHWTLNQLDTTKLHFVKVPTNHIVID